MHVLLTGPFGNIGSHTTLNFCGRVIKCARSICAHRARRKWRSVSITSSKCAGATFVTRLMCKLPSQASTRSYTSPRSFRRSASSSRRWPSRSMWVGRAILIEAAQGASEAAEVLLCFVVRSVWIYARSTPAAPRDRSGTGHGRLFGAQDRRRGAGQTIGVGVGHHAFL